MGIQVSLLPDELEGGPGAENTIVRHNVLRGSRDGIYVLETADNTLIEDNLALASEDDGIAPSSLVRDPVPVEVAG